jgi:hypothetical protein
MKPRQPATRLSVGCLRLRGTTLLGSILAAGLVAQTAPPVPAPSPNDEQPVALSPFVVSDATDVGYLASNTLAGSRMNTDLRNVANVVSSLRRSSSRTLAPPASTT